MCKTQYDLKQNKKNIYLKNHNVRHAETDRTDIFLANLYLVFT